MNLRLFSLAVLISALPAWASADVPFSLTKEDFIAAERVSPEGETVLKVKLSKSGKAKFKKWQQSGPSQVHVQIGAVDSDFKLRVPITGDSLQIGPYSDSDASEVLQTLNHR